MVVTVTAKRKKHMGKIKWRNSLKACSATIKSAHWYNATTAWSSYLRVWQLAGISEDSAIILMAGLYFCVWNHIQFCQFLNWFLRQLLWIFESFLLKTQRTHLKQNRTSYCRFLIRWMNNDHALSCILFFYVGAFAVLPSISKRFTYLLTYIRLYATTYENPRCECLWLNRSLELKLFSWAKWCVRLGVDEPVRGSSCVFHGSSDTFKQPYSAVLSSIVIRDSRY